MMSNVLTTELVTLIGVQRLTTEL